MESALLYKMTIWTGPTYDEVGGKGVLTIEAYFKVALWGSRRENRNYLFSIGVPFFQDWVSRHFGLYVPQGEIKVRFERERPAETEEGEIIVDFRVMTYRGKQVSARALPSQIIPLEDEGDRGYDPEYDDSAASEEDDYEDSDWGDTDEEW